MDGRDTILDLYPPAQVREGDECLPRQYFSPMPPQTGTWGTIRDFVADLELIFGYSEITFTDHRSAIITLGSGHLMAQGEFFFDGRVYIPLLGTYEQIAENINGTLHMYRADFYRAMGVDFVRERHEFTVTSGGNLIQSGIVGFAVAGLTAKAGVANWMLGFGIGFLGDGLLGMTQRTPGDYVVYSTLAIVYIPMSGGRHEGILTRDIMVWATDSRGNPILVRADERCFVKYFIHSVDA